MIAASRCNCLVCQLEGALITELGGETPSEQFRSLNISSTVRLPIPTPTALIRELHDHSSEGRNALADELILNILNRRDDIVFSSIRQQLLLLVFIPTVHRTTSQVAASFPSLARDDIAQHIFAVLLEFLDSKELSSRRSHLAFAVARKIRRSAFRWAIRESRHAFKDDLAASPEDPADLNLRPSDHHSELVLRQFLDTCQRKGLLTSEERSLLTKFKLEGATGPELARNNGHSAIAIRHRVQRVIGRLRRVAKHQVDTGAKQLDLFVR
jgi:DNA-directed RNA polymerase specialized sigma24 family protein